uniref:Transmembrane protein 100 n=1 Tax=Meleagris gallopavo TaxID=9103 RepID=A0A803XSA7_MELGA
STGRTLSSGFRDALPASALVNMMGCKSNSLTCLQGGKAGLPLAAATDSTATLNKLALATGGTEKSWYRCIFPFGIVSVVIGVAATCITFTINGPQMDIAKVVSVATLIFGVGLLVAAYVCWRAKRERQQRRQRQEPGSVEQGAQ